MTRASNLPSTPSFKAIVVLGDSCSSSKAFHASAKLKVSHYILCTHLQTCNLTSRTVSFSINTIRTSTPKPHSASPIPLWLSSKGVLVYPEHRQRRRLHSSSTVSSRRQDRTRYSTLGKSTFATMSEAESLAKSSAWANPGSAALDFRSTNGSLE